MAFWRSFLLAISTSCLIACVPAVAKRIPSTLEGSFEPVTVPYDVSLRGNAVDLPDSDPRVRRQVSGFEPEQISVSFSVSHDSVWISWVTGEFQIGDNIKPLDPKTVSSVVRYGRSRFPLTHEARGHSLVYNQLYPFEGLKNYTSGIIHHVRLTGEQYKWLERDLAYVDTSTTPRLVAAWHPPWFSSYKAHYREAECMRVAMEELLYSYGVDIVFNGHVHAYERTNRVYTYTLDPCAPVYITVGDGGNREKMEIKHADEPGNCPEPSTTRDLHIGGFCATIFPSGPVAGKFCWDRQPDYSAFRESSFGHGILEVKNATWALWTWYRNQDSHSEVGDQIYIVRQSDICPIHHTRRSWFAVI